MPKPKEQARKTGMARLWELAAAKKALILSACALAVISTAVSFTPFVAVYYIIRELVARYADLGALDTAYLARLGWLAAGGAVAAIVLNFIALMCSHIAAFTTQYKLKLDFTRHIASLPLGFHTGNSTGKLRKIVDENIEKLESFTAHQIPDMAGTFALPAISLAILFVFDWRLGLASLAPILLSYIIQMIAMGGSQARQFLQKYQDSLEDMNNAAVEYVRGITVVKAFNQTIFSFRKFRDTIASYGQFVSAYTTSFEGAYVLFMVVINHVYLFIVPVIILISGGAQDYGAFALSSLFYLIFSVSLPTAFVKIMYVSQNGRMVADGIARMDRIMDVRPLPEAANPKTTAEYSVAFENVTFAYGGIESGGGGLGSGADGSSGESAKKGGKDGAEVKGGGKSKSEGGSAISDSGSDSDGERVALSNVSFTARQGEITALVGPSGGGKSTLAHLIPRFYDVAGGAVKIGGVDIRDMSADYLMGLVGFVFQDVFLFKQSILDNIRIGRKSASCEDVAAAAKAAQCHDFIERLPQGYDTVIGSEGVHLSGGERQRLVIARALLKDAPILVLDEATAFADPENEQKIQLAFEQLMKNKTVIIIAHRLSTVRGADKIVVMDRGAKAEEGSHGELAGAGGRYSRMWEQYSGSLAWTLAGKEAGAWKTENGGGA
ncbi:MAG: ABC transporter ATP-binding protein/permease [Clostridiales bacterium]|jgi:ATP-binding cassette subfamily B protein|nr:ABC transporter ATP-binding protein/permease [Clostridiales bacterium]